MADFDVRFTEQQPFNVLFDDPDLNVSFGSAQSFSSNFVDGNFTVMFSDQGTDGAQGAYRVFLFRRSPVNIQGQSGPSDVIWTPGTGRGTLSGANADGWSLVPPPGTDDLYNVDAVFNPAINTDVTDWSGVFVGGGEGPPGLDGRGITTIVQTPTNPAPGDTVTLTLTYTDGSTSVVTFQVPMNGMDGMAGAAGMDGTDGLSVSRVTTSRNADNDGTVVNFFVGSTNIGSAVIPDGMDGMAGAPGSSDTDVTVIENWSSTANYVANQLVVFEGDVYRAVRGAITATTDTPPSLNGVGDGWELVVEGGNRQFYSVTNEGARINLQWPQLRDGDVAFQQDLGTLWRASAVTQQSPRATWTQIQFGAVLTVEDEGGNPVSDVDTINFVGPGVTVTDDGNGDVSVNIPGASPFALTVEDEGSDTGADATILNFTGDGVTATGSGSTKTINIPSFSLTVEDEGTDTGSDANILDFRGAGVTVTGTGAQKTITIPGGGGGTPVNPPAHAIVTVNQNFTEIASGTPGTLMFLVSVSSSDTNQDTFTFSSITNATSGIAVPTISGNNVSVAIPSNQAVGTYETAFDVNYVDGNGNMFTNHIRRNVVVSASWFTDLATTVPANNAAMDARGAFQSGDSFRFVGTASNPRIYIALPTGSYEFRTGLAFIDATQITAGYTQAGYELYELGTIGSGEDINIVINTA